jgi:Ca2+-binding EF-hand superfamily protein
MEELLSNGLNVFPKFDPSKHDSPMKFLLDFIKEHRKQSDMEQNELVANAKAECTSETDVVVKLSSNDAKWHMNTLQGCSADSMCGTRATKYVSSGTNNSACVQENTETSIEQASIAKSRKEFSVEKEHEIRTGDQRRVVQKKLHEQHIHEHEEAVRVLEHILEVILNSKSWKQLMSKEDKTKLEKTPDGILAMMLIETANGAGRDELKRLRSVVGRLIHSMKRSTNDLKQKEALEADEWADDRRELVADKAKALNEANAASDKMKVADSKKGHCEVQYNKAGKRYEILVKDCIKMHTTYTRIYEDNEHMVALTERVHEIIGRTKNKLKAVIRLAVKKHYKKDATGNTEKEEPSSTGLAATAATGPATMASGATGSVKAATASTGPAATASTGPAATASAATASTGPSATASATASATGPSATASATASATGPSATASATGLLAKRIQEKKSKTGAATAATGAATATMGATGVRSATGSMTGSSTAMTGSSTGSMTASTMGATAAATGATAGATASATGAVEEEDDEEKSLSQSSKDLVARAMNNLWKEMAKVLDHNRDGVITEDEVRSTTLKLPNSQHLTQQQMDVLSKRAHAAYMQMDLNKDGKVKKEEIIKFTKFYLMQKAMHMSKLYLNHFKAGQHQHLTFEQFYLVTKRYGKDVATTRKIFDLFKGADETVDGAELGHYLTVQEIANGFSYLKFLKKKEEEIIKPQPKVEDKVDELKKASHELWETLRAKFDHNKDGNITQSEIKSVTVKSNYQAKLLAQLQRLLNAANKNKDNTITKTELMNMIYTQLLPKVSEDLAKRAAKVFGGMGDKRMNEEEFHKFWPNTGSITSKVFAAFKGEDGLVDASAVSRYYMTNFALQYKKIALHAA